MLYDKRRLNKSTKKKERDVQKERGGGEERSSLSAKLQATRGGLSRGKIRAEKNKQKKKKEAKRIHERTRES